MTLFSSLESLLHRILGRDSFKGEGCNTPGVCHLLSTRFELKHDKFNGNKKVEVNLRK